MADTGYIESYNDISVHQLMLEDRPRTLAYKNFMHKNKQYIQVALRYSEKPVLIILIASFKMAG